MIELVPSCQVRDYLQEIKFEFSDLEKAALIWNGYGYTWQEGLDALRELMLQTEDKKTKKQIEQRLNYEKRVWQAFEENQENKYIYVVSDGEGCYGCFSKSGIALHYAKEKAVKEQEAFLIEKQLLITEEPIPMVKSGIRVNYHVLNGENKIEEFVEFNGQAVSSLRMDSNGRIIWIGSIEISEEEEIDEFDTERFENCFIPIPYPKCFQRGVCVKYIPTGEYGILATSKSQWETFCEKVKNGFYADYVDVCVTVVFLTEEGYWSHEHINPIYLETGMPEENSIYCQALKALSNYWSEDADGGSEETVLKTCREYADSCKKENTIEKAKTLKDIMI